MKLQMPRGKMENYCRVRQGAFSPAERWGVLIYFSMQSQKYFVRFFRNIELGYNHGHGIKFWWKMKSKRRLNVSVRLLRTFDIYSAEGLFSLNVFQGYCHAGLVLTLLTFLEFLTSALSSFAKHKVSAISQIRPRFRPDIHFSFVFISYGSI